MVDITDRGRDVDDALCRYLAGVLGRIDAVDGTSLFSATKPDRLVVTFDSRYYPATVETVRLEIRVFTNGDFNVSYVEEFLGESRRCRWDRHEQDHSSRDHFHPLPDASTAAAADREFPTDVTALLQQVVFPWIERRLGTLWEADREAR